MKLALCQTEICFEDKEANLKICESFIEKAAGNADIALFPEMSLTGFSMNTDKTKENGETKSFFSNLSKKYGIAVGFGWVLDCGEKSRNMYTVVGKNGEEFAEYAKIHPFSYAGEDRFFEGGNERCVFDFFGLKIGIAICYDLRFPRLFEENCDIWFVPANWPQKRDEHWISLLKARAIEEQAYFAGINCTGTADGLEYSGKTALFAPDGKKLGELGNKADILFADVSKETVDKCRSVFPVLNDRKYDIYKNWL